MRGRELYCIIQEEQLQQPSGNGDSVCHFFAECHIKAYYICVPIMNNGKSKVCEVAVCSQDITVAHMHATFYAL